MESYGLRSIGRIICQIVYSLPVFQDSDTGRFIYVNTQKSLYVGGIDRWVCLIENDKLSLESISSIDVDLENTEDNFHSRNRTVEDALNALCRGLPFKDKILKTQHYKDNSITSNKINFGTRTDQVNANNIPARFKSETKTIQEIINILQKQCIMKHEYFIDQCSWAYDDRKDLYYYSLSSETTWTTMFPIYQCYYNGETIYPISVLVNVPGRTITFFLTNRMDLHVTLIA